MRPKMPPPEERGGKNGLYKLKKITTITVLLLPPRAFLSKLVRAESRNGT